MDRAERARKIEVYGNAYKELVDGLREFPREMWDYRAASDPWTIREIVVHIADSEANSYVRFRRFIAEPGKDVMAYDENGWSSALNYTEQDPDDAIELFRWLRSNTYKLVQKLPESAWTNTVFHPENGTMTLDGWLDVYESHVRDHLEQIGRIYAAWKQERV